MTNNITVETKTKAYKMKPVKFTELKAPDLYSTIYVQLKGGQSMIGTFQGYENFKLLIQKPENCQMRLIEESQVFQLFITV